MKLYSAQIPPGGCCTTGGDLFASAFLVTSRSASIVVHSDTHCSGITKSGGKFKCVQPSFAFSASHWTRSNSNRDETETFTNSSLCQRPDTITLIDINGKAVNITIPEGENTEYEHEFAMGNYATLMEMANISRLLHF
ncbi:hypothetical protein Agabi119p4_8376 [Agaricus bisporus var. burnettii]|uniref:Uncharacterized protein n=1 Tax=Agaricus bisporus var. burnettii TaxID=192524 RepID=A0A8H7C6Z2_AGABI|nr:hypothetical protein Agabi119p4_8376 [Agaricus bisporus var. burnettii]